MKPLARSGRAARAAFVCILLLGAAAQAAPISMSPDPVTLNGIRGSFSLSLSSGDSSTNTLVFDLVGSDPSGSLPAFGVAAIVFHGPSIVSANELLDPDGLITGFALPASGTVAGVLIDFGPASIASFEVVLSALPKTATVYSLGTASASVAKTKQMQRVALASAHVRFDTKSVETSAIPEPGAALCFAAGLLLVASRRRR